MDGFTVYWSGGNAYTSYGEDASYQLDEGVLIIYNGEGKRLTFSPNAWQSIEEDV
jgi:hypothetical protein